MATDDYNFRPSFYGYCLYRGPLPCAHAPRPTMPETIFLYRKYVLDFFIGIFDWMRIARYGAIKIVFIMDKHGWFVTYVPLLGIIIIKRQGYFVNFFNLSAFIEGQINVKKLREVTVAISIFLIKVILNTSLSGRIFFYRFGILL